MNPTEVRISWHRLALSKVGIHSRPCGLVVIEDLIWDYVIKDYHDPYCDFTCGSAYFTVNYPATFSYQISSERLVRISLGVIFG
jgi:hypothetical protein